MTNRYAGVCVHCDRRVPARAGKLWKSGGAWRVAHLACADAGEPAVITVATSGWTGTQNARGRCEDAPCCGCCTF